MAKFLCIMAFAYTPYRWSNGATMDTVVLIAENYTVTITDSGGL